MDFDGIKFTYRRAELFPGIITTILARINTFAERHIESPKAPPMRSYRRSRQTFSTHIFYMCVTPLIDKINLPKFFTGSGAVQIPRPTSRNSSPIPPSRPQRPLSQKPNTLPLATTATNLQRQPRRKAKVETSVRIRFLQISPMKVSKSLVSADKGVKKKKSLCSNSDVTFGGPSTVSLLVYLHFPTVLLVLLC